jgi:hypothetical protein
MKRAALIGLGLLMSLALVAPASACVFVFADVQKDKDITVVENITITKTATIDVTVIEDLTAAAESLALGNQENLDNEVAGIDGPSSGNDREALIEFSIGTDEETGNIGIVGVNQSTGNMNNQGNNVAAAVTGSEDAFVNAESSASQINAGNSVDAVDETKISDIDTSVNYNMGIVGVNQSTGNMNNQLNNVALAAGLGGAPVALAEADLGQLNADNTVIETFSFKDDIIQDSINNNQGIVGVNQSTGNMNNQANVVAIGAVVN